MGVKDAWPHYAGEGVRVYELPGVRKAASQYDTRFSASPSAVLLVDGGAFVNKYIKALQREVSRTEISLFLDKQFDFSSDIRIRALASYHADVDSLVRTELVSQLGVERAIVCWDDARVSPTAKVKEQEKRHREREKERPRLKKALFDVLTSEEGDEDNHERINRLAKTAGIFAFGPAVPPENVICEKDAGFDWKTVGVDITICNVTAEDEADLAIARAELELDHIIVFTHDCDLLFLVNCVVFRQLPRSSYPFEVIKGQRSAVNVVLGQVAGQDYTCSVGLYGHAFKTFIRLIKKVEGYEDLDALTLFDRTIALAKKSGRSFDREQVEGVSRGIQIWVDRSHGDAIVTRTPFVLTHTELRHLAFSEDDMAARAEEKVLAAQEEKIALQSAVELEEETSTDSTSKLNENTEAPDVFHDFDGEDIDATGPASLSSRIANTVTRRLRHLRL